MKTTRTFVAVVVAEAQRAKLARLQGLLAPDLPDVRWAATSPFHITLAFLGDVEDSELNKVCRAVECATRDAPRLALRIEGLGAFPSPERPRILWAGLTGSDLPALIALQGTVAAAMTELGYPHDNPVFHPHITLGRVPRGRGGPANLGPLVKHYQTWSAGSFPVVEVVTFASTLTREGPVYAPLARAPLAAGKAGPAA